MTAFSFADERVTIVGILNVTPDSFSDGGSFLDVDTAVAHGLRLFADGAHLVDIGGESTRPGASEVAIDEELARVLPVITALVGRGVAVSVDSRRAPVAAAAVAAGACVINDVGGLRDPDMVAVVASAQVPVIVMHTPSADLADTHRFGGYLDVISEVRAFLADQVLIARRAGVREVVVDPGLGFGKSVDDNVNVLRGLSNLTTLGCPVLVGASRKRFVGAISGVGEAPLRDAATIAVHIRAVMNGATALRVHDVAGHVQALAAWAATAGPPA